MEIDANALISAISAICVAVLTGLFARDNKRRKAHEDELEARARKRAQESHLSMQLMSASVKLGIATALAVEQKKFNGEMKDARESADKAQKAYWEFINHTAADEIWSNTHQPNQPRRNNVSN